MITPQGTVWLGTVPWDSTYRHVYYEGMMDKAGKILPFMTMQSTDYTYIREDTNIRVPYNADSLYGINYCMYQNDGMWFCSFVKTISYVNNNTSLLHLQEDMWHTWGSSLVWKACLVAREHVNSDNLGEWRAPEPAMELEGVTLTVNDFNRLARNCIVVGTNAIPHLKAGVSGTIFDRHTEDDFDGSDPVSGGYYNTIYSGAAYYGFDSSSVQELSYFLSNLNRCGAAESVCSMFMVPSNFLTVDSEHRVTSYATGGLDDGFDAPQYHSNGYVPRNKKCLTFPYAYATLTDYTGGMVDIKYEDCNTWGEVRYRFQQGLDPTAQIFCTMLSYMGQSMDPSHMIPVSQNPQCSWVYSAYLNWLGQQSTVINTKNTVNFVQAVGGIAAIVAGGLMIASGALSPEGIMAAGEGTAMLAGGLVNTGIGMASTGIRGAVDTALQMDVQSKVPNRTVGSSSSNSLQGIARNEGGFICRGLQRESAERLDNFFDVFGYEVDKVKVPNVTGRLSWNYVKTVGACMGGGVPADRLSKMNECLDSGITFWHTVDVGDYGLTNPIV